MEEYIYISLHPKMLQRMYVLDRALLILMSSKISAYGATISASYSNRVRRYEISVALFSIKHICSDQKKVCFISTAYDSRWFGIFMDENGRTLHASEEKTYFLHLTATSVGGCILFEIFESLPLIFVFLLRLLDGKATVSNQFFEFMSTQNYLTLISECCSYWSFAFAHIYAACTQLRCQLMLNNERNDFPLHFSPPAKSGTSCIHVAAWQNWKCEMGSLQSRSNQMRCSFCGELTFLQRILTTVLSSNLTVLDWND